MTVKYAGLIKHGCSRKGKETREYLIWMGIRKRVHNKRCRIYRYYGGRGIRICKRWDDFRKFLKDMGPCPSPRHSIDRKNSDGDYKPSNCRWATKSEQMRNKSDNVNLTLYGRTLCIAAWAEATGIPVATIRKRYYADYPVEKILHVGKLSTRWRK